MKHANHRHFCHWLPSGHRTKKLEISIDFPALNGRKTRSFSERELSPAIATVGGTPEGNEIQHS